MEPVFVAGAAPVRHALREAVPLLPDLVAPQDQVQAGVRAAEQSGRGIKSSVHLVFRFGQREAAKRDVAQDGLCQVASQRAVDVVSAKGGQHPRAAERVGPGQADEALAWHAPVASPASKRLRVDGLGPRLGGLGAGAAQSSGRHGAAGTAGACEGVPEVDPDRAFGFQDARHLGGGRPQRLQKRGWGGFAADLPRASTVRAKRVEGWGGHDQIDRCVRERDVAGVGADWHCAYRSMVCCRRPRHGSITAARSRMSRACRQVRSRSQPACLKQ